ncbi:hypothetical protein ABZ686_29515, partial [Streptomyces sp. NPDC006992]
MTPLQLVSRPLLGVFFVNAGVGTLSRPEPPAELAAPFLERLREKVPLPVDGRADVSEEETCPSSRAFPR